MKKVSCLGAVLAAGVLAAGVGACTISSGSPAARPSAASLTRQWTVNEDGELSTSGPLVADGTIVAPTSAGLSALSLSTGHTEWSWYPPASTSGPSTSVDVSQNTANGTGLVTYAYGSDSASSSTSVTAGPRYQAWIDLADGSVLWTHPVSGTVSTEPPGDQVGDGVVADLDTAGHSASDYITVTSLSTGQTAWSTQSDPALRGCRFGGLAISGGAVYGAATCSGTFTLYGLSAATGAVQSKVTDAQACGNPTVWAASGYLLVGCPGGGASGSQRVLAFRPGSSHPVAVTYTSPDSSFAYPAHPGGSGPRFAVVGTTLYIETGGNAVDGFSLVSGKKLWQRKSPGNIIGTGVGDVLFADNGPGGAVSLSALSASTGAISHGPATRLNVPSPGSYHLTLSGHTLIATASNPGSSPIIAYSTGSWPN